MTQTNRSAAHNEAAAAASSVREDCKLLPAGVVREQAARVPWSA
jgi:hypothetical protein